MPLIIKLSMEVLGRFNSVLFWKVLKGSRRLKNILVPECPINGSKRFRFFNFVDYIKFGFRAPNVLTIILFFTNHIKIRTNLHTGLEHEVPTVVSIRCFSFLFVHFCTVETKYHS